MDHDRAAVAPRRGFGLAATLPPATIGALARAAQAAGYNSFWVNDGPGGEGLAALEVAAGETDAIDLCVGVIPLDRRAPEDIAERIAELGLPVHRLAVGIGAGAGPGGVDRVRDGVHRLRDLTSARVVVGALGPRISRVAAEVADGLLIDWPVPAHARVVAGQVARAAAAAGVPRPPVLGYVFTGIGATARRRLRAEADHYGAIPAYAAHFARMGVAADDAHVHGDTAARVRHRLTAFGAALDETVVRATVGDDTPAAYLEVLSAAAPAPPHPA